MTSDETVSFSFATSNEALSDARLAEIVAEVDSGRYEFTYDGGRAVRELLAEVERLRNQPPCDEVQCAAIECERDEFRIELEQFRHEKAEQESRHAERKPAEPADICRPVTVEVDGEPVTIRVRGEQPMSEESRAAFAEIIAAAKRKFEAEPKRDDLCEACGFPTGTYPHRKRCGAQQ